MACGTLMAIGRGETQHTTKRIGDGLPAHRGWLASAYLSFVAIAGLAATSSGRELSFGWHPSGCGNTTRAASHFPSGLS